MEISKEQIEKVLKDVIQISNIDLNNLTRKYNTLTVMIAIEMYRENIFNHDKELKNVVKLTCELLNNDKNTVKFVLEEEVLKEKEKDNL